MRKITYVADLPNVIGYWDYSSNDIDPKTVPVSSRLPVQWICPEGHEWSNTIFNMTRSRRCPYCAGE